MVALSSDVVVQKAVKYSVPKQSLRFQSQHRLKKSTDFAAVFQQQNKTVAKYFVVYQRDNDFHCYRLGVVVSKKQAAHAVDRNRLKRLVKEAFRLNQHQIRASDYVVVGRGRAVQASNDEIRRCLSWILSQIAV